MEIVIAYNYDPSCIRGGGGITYVHNLVNYLLDTDHRVILFGVKLSDKILFNHKNFKFIPVLVGSDNWWKFLMKLGPTIKKENISHSSIIHTHHPLIMYPFIRALPNNPKICTFHGVTMDWIKVNYPLYFSLLLPLYTLVESHILQKTDLIATAGQYPKIGLIKRHPDLYLDKKLVVIPSGVNLNKFKPMDKTLVRTKFKLLDYQPILIYLGRLSKQKNIELLLKGFSIFQKEFCNARLIIIGTGEHENGLRTFVLDYDIKNIIFKGHVDSRDVPELINCADVLILTSWYEASPTVVKESIACGVPIVTTNVGDINDIITDPFIGSIIPEYNEFVLARFIKETLELTKNNQGVVRNKCITKALNEFGFDKVAESYIKAYERLNGRALRSGLGNS